MKRPGKWFTLVFEGDIVAFPSNPLKADTVFGIPYAVRSSDALEELDRITAERDGLRKALEFYADPFAWKKQHDPENDVQVPDFYSETSFGDTARAALTSCVPDADRSPHLSSQAEEK